MRLRIAQFSGITVHRGEEIGTAVGGLDADQDKGHATENHLDGLALILGESIRANFTGFSRINDP